MSEPIFTLNLGEMIPASEFSCIMCDKVCSDEDDLEWHARRQHSRKSESVYSCNLCDWIMTGENSLERSIRRDLDQHIREQHTYWCHNCYTTSDSESWKSNHFRTQWVHHMTKEHRMRELKLLSSENTK